MDGNFKSKESYKNKEELINKAPKESYVDLNELDNEPRANGGLKALQKFISENSKFPVEAQGKDFVERIYVEFLITKEGGVSEVKVIKGFNPAEKSEAVRLVKEFGEKGGWEPGILKGEPVITKMIMPFSLIPNWRKI